MKSDPVSARRYRYASRFIDDQCNLNDAGQFNKSCSSIYPPELHVKCEHEGLHATFLELDISVKDNIFVYKLFDKRDGFPFLSFVCQIFLVTFQTMFFMALLCLNFCV